MEDITLAKYNCKSVKRAVEGIRLLCNYADIIALQETWLLPGELSYLSNIHDDFESTGTSAVDVAAGILKGRPYGGVALLWRKSVFKCVSVIQCENPRITAIRVTTNSRCLLILSIYMPIDNSENRAEFMDCLSTISAIIEENNIESVFMLGDYNAHPYECFHKDLESFMADQDWWAEWLVTTNNVHELWKAQPSYLISQAGYIFAGLVTLIHAFRKGGRWPWFWLATVIHGLYADNFWHFVLPEYDNFWHSQTPVMFLGARQPLHIILLYPAFLYHAAYAVSRLNLPKYAEPFAVGLVTVLIDIPYDIVAVKFVHWTWHDTDPNIFDRHYWVPWNSYYFHATFAASLVFFFNAARSFMAPKVAKWDSAGFKTEFKAMLVAVMFGMPGGVLMFVPLYHPLHDMYKVHSEVTVFALFAIFAAFVFCGLMADREKPKSRLTAIDYVIIVQLILHYLTYWALVVWGHPEREYSTGLHEPVGPCDEVASLTSPFGQTLYKRKYFCPQKYNEDYFDFRCVKQLPPNGATWYTICGTPFENRVEYITVLSTILVAAFGIFYAIYRIKPNIEPTRKQKTK